MKTHPRVIVTILFVLVLALGLALLMFFLRRESELLVFRDSFESELQKGWSIFNEDPTHYSLVKRTGSLTVTTQSGGIYAGARNARNLFLLENPLSTDEDFEILTLLSSFTPVAEFQQAGLLCFDDPDNYVKACYLFDRRSGGRPHSPLPSPLTPRLCKPHRSRARKRRPSVSCRWQHRQWRNPRRARERRCGCYQRARLTRV